MFSHRPEHQRDLIARTQAYPPETVEKAQRALGQCVWVVNMPHPDQGFAGIVGGIEKMNHVEKSYLWGLVLALSENTIRKRGRLDGLLNRLGKKATDRLSKMPRLRDSEIRQVQAKYSDFAAKVGWGKKELSALTWANFLLALLDDAPTDFDRAIDLINQIAAYLEHGKRAQPACYWAAAKAAEAFQA